MEIHWRDLRREGPGSRLQRRDEDRWPGCWCIGIRVMLEQMDQGQGRCLMCGTVLRSPCLPPKMWLGILMDDTPGVPPRTVMVGYSSLLNLAVPAQCPSCRYPQAPASVSSVSSRVDADEPGTLLLVSTSYAFVSLFSGCHLLWLWTCPQTYG